jgi:hypothetical protein
MKNFLLFVVTVLFLTACSNSGNKTISPKQSIEITNDMENAQGMIPSWVGAERVFAMTDPPAHSGTYACITNDSAEYSYHYEEILKNINGVVPTRVMLSGWVYTTVANPDLAIVFALNLNDDPKTLDWKSFPLNQQLPEAGKWVEFSGDFYMDYKEINTDLRASVYLWNQSKKPIYIDDLKVTFFYY